MSTYFTDMPLVYLFHGKLFYFLVHHWGARIAQWGARIAQWGARIAQLGARIAQSGRPDSSVGSAFGF